MSSPLVVFCLVFDAVIVIIRASSSSICRYRHTVVLEVAARGLDVVLFDVLDVAAFVFTESRRSPGCRRPQGQISGSKPSDEPWNQVSRPRRG
jgi:hypothetical protein